VGQAGRRETVNELRLEVLCPAARLGAILTAIRARHSYEEPAIDIYPLFAPGPQHPPQNGAGADTEASAGAGGGAVVGLGSGRVGRFVEARTLAEFAAMAGRVLGHVVVQVVGDPNRRVLKVAVACGAGGGFLEDAARAGADALLTGEVRFHRGIEAEALGLGLVVAGHYATERLGVEDLAQRLAVAFPSLTVWPSRSEHDPFRVMGAGPGAGASETPRAPIPTPKVQH
jgi:putative NIF3 family GTP cyclohydrolase 1 type 2